MTTIDSVPGATRIRKPIDAASLSALLPGLGHLYCGKFQRGILWMGTSVALILAAIIALIIQPSRAGFTSAMVFLAIDLIIWIACAALAWRLAKRQEGDYTLREYNRWYVYLILLVLGGFGSAIGFSFVLHERVVQAFVIPSRSMEPTISHGDRILTLKEVYLDRDPQPGELVVFRNPENRRQFYVKRVIAIAGDHVSWESDGEITVNGSPLDQAATDASDIFSESINGRTYRIKSTIDEHSPFVTPGSLTIPPHHAFVLGDHRSFSRDSRQFGPVSYAAMEAAPVAKIWGGLGALR